MRQSINLSNETFERQSITIRREKKPVKANGYDYRHQAYVINGRYVACGHGNPCDCYGTVHAGQPAAADADIH
jgi:hypothetical protein